MQIFARNIPHLSLARLPTPMVPLRRFCQANDLPLIWVKRDDLTGTPGSGNKLRKLEFTVGQALEENASVLITCGGVQSNHCRATALVASQLGLKCHLILRGEDRPPADGNLMLDQLLGAKITYLSGSDYNTQLEACFIETADAYRTSGEIPFLIPVGASDEIGLWGYIQACAELQQDFAELAIAPGYLVSAAGSGGTAGGLILGNHRYQLNSHVLSFNVCDDEAYFVNKINQDFTAWQLRYDLKIGAELPIHIVEGYVGPGYGKAEKPIFDTISAIARSEGLILDPVYTGKAFHGLVSELKRGNFCDTSDIVFIHTGGIFGLFPQRDQLHAAISSNGHEPEKQHA